MLRGRQQPSTARGTIFVSLQDETGYSQVIVWRNLRDARRDALLSSRLLEVHGVWHRGGGRLAEAVWLLVGGSAEEV